METKHTKGEWKVKIFWNKKLLPAIIISCNGEEVANIRFTFWSLKRKEAEANAKLIAAAPKLLETLIEIQNYIDKLGSRSIAMQVINLKSKEAIKKATE